MSFIIPVSEINDAKQQDFFNELVDIYVRLVRICIQKYDIPFPRVTELTEKEIAELCGIGFITQAEDISKLKLMLGTRFNDLVAAVHIQTENPTIDWSSTLFLRTDTRKKLQEKFKRTTKYTLADFFCGAGGLSLGFRKAGFNIKFANDFEDVCVSTYRFNHPEIPENKIVSNDIKDIVGNIADYINEKIDVVVGGPPCQGFSEANRQRVIDDPRNELYKFFLKAVSQIAPKFVVMENVKGMLKVADQIIEDYQKIRVCIAGKEVSYKVACHLLNSQMFSVAQSRERLIFIAIREDIATEKKISPDQIFEDILHSCQGYPTYILADALSCIKPLEAPRIKNQNEIDSEKSGKKIDVNTYDTNENAYLKLINSGRNIELVYNHKARYCNDVNYEIYKRLCPGDDATDEKIKDIMPYAHRNHCFKDKYYKLHPDRPCRTITAHLKMDCHSHIHPFQIRSLTPREAARVQSFPDDYFFLGAYLKTYMQIGNAVPPLMAQGIATAIKKYL